MGALLNALAEDSRPKRLPERLAEDQFNLASLFGDKVAEQGLSDLITGETPEREAGFWESLSGVPEQFARYLAAGAGPEQFAHIAGQAALDVVQAREGDLEAKKRVRARGIAASGATALIPGGAGVVSRAALGALGGASGGALEAGATGGPVGQRAAEGAAIGAVLNPAFGFVGDVLVRPAAAAVRRLVRLGRPVPAKLAEAVRSEAARLSDIEAVRGPRGPWTTVAGTTEREIAEEFTAKFRSAYPKEQVEFSVVRLLPDSPQGIRQPGTMVVKRVGDDLTPDWVFIPEHMRRKGIGIDLYLEAAQEAANRGSKLVSSDDMSAAATGVWKALVRRGQAIEVAPGNFQAVGFRPTPLPGDPVQRVVQALKEVPDLRKEQEALYRLERGKRIGRFEGSLKAGEGEAGARAAMGEMAGELPKVEFGSLRPLVAQADIDQLFNIAKTTPLLGNFERLRATKTLLDLFEPEGVKLPTRSDLAVLEKAFGPELVETLLAKRGGMSFFKRAGLEILNAPRVMMSSFDLSAPLRQGLFIGAGHPKEFASAFGRMFKVLGSERAMRELEAEIAQRPTYELMHRAGLALTKAGSALGNQEEAFMGRLAQKIPGIKASERAYTGFLNKIRADVFDSMVKDAARAGLPLDDVALREIGGFVNAASGRGNLPAWVQKHAQTLNAVLFSPRLVASRIQILNPAMYIRSNKIVRQHAVRSLLSLGSLASTAIYLAHLAGGETETDPTSADWGKLKFGNTRYDILGGFQQYLRLGATMAQGIAEEEGFSGKVVGGVQPLPRFVRQKLAPVPSLAMTLFEGQDMEGNDVSVPVEVAKRFTPMLLQDLWEAYKDMGWIGLAASAPSIFGVATQTYE